EPAPILAARLITQTSLATPLPPIAMRLATTRGTNALLERRAGPAALFITQGFRDLLAIGTQQRPDLFTLDIKKPEPIDAGIVEVPGRLDKSGRDLWPLSLQPVEDAARPLLAKGVKSVAIALMHSWINPDHEHRVAAFLQALGFTHISCSSDLAPAIKILP